MGPPVNMKQIIHIKSIEDKTKERTLPSLLTTELFVFTGKGLLLVLK
jgi:hypothetical protein